MKSLYEVAAKPSGWDSYSNYTGEIPPKDLLVVMTRTRGADLLTESNWEVALKRLGGESDDVVIHRFGHWACGWWEALCVQAGTESEKQGERIVEKIKGYPVLDEDDFSERETNEANRVWRDCYNPKQRVEYIRDNGGADFRSFADLRSCIRGEYAPYTNDGYAGLIY